jgi:hypothetical protein
MSKQTDQRSVPHQILIRYETDGLDGVTDHKKIERDMKKAFEDAARPYVHLLDVNVKWSHPRIKGQK